MAKSDFHSVDDYIVAQPEATQAALRQVRKIILKAVPQAEETISYNMPTFKLGGERFLFLAGWKQHYSLYPATKSVLAQFENELELFDVKKSTIRFSLSEPVPARLIENIAKFRAKEVAKPAKPSGKKA